MIESAAFVESLIASQPQESHQVAPREPAAFTLPDDDDEQKMNLTMITLEASIGSDETPSKVFWGALTKVVPITSFAELMASADKAQRSASQHLKDMNMPRSYRKVISLAGGDGGLDLLLDSLLVSRAVSYQVHLLSSDLLSRS